MKKIIGMAVVLSLMGVQLGGCASLRSIKPEFGNKMEMGMLGGCISGVVIGGLAGNVLGAMLGGMLGTVVGGVAGAQFDKKTGTREQALLKYRFEGGEEKLFVERSSVNAEDGFSGETIQTSVRYTIIAPADIEEINITETRLLFGEAKGFLKVDRRQFRRTQGTYRSTFRFTASPELLKDYPMVVTMISSDKQTRTITSRLL